MSGREQPGAASGGSGLLSSGARTLYLTVVRDKGRLRHEACQEGDISALEELLSLGLLVPDTDEPGVLVAADPTQLGTSLAGMWQRQALDLLSRAVSLPADLHELARAFHVPDQIGGPIEYIRGKVLINQRVQQLIAAGMDEGLAMQPGGPRPADALSAVMARDLETLRRGAKMRTIYHASTRYHQPTRDYVATLAEAGGQFRTLDEPYTRLIIIDRRIAVIPVMDDLGMAAFIRDQGVVNYLVEEVFERCWSRALDFDGDRAVPQQVVSRLRQTVVELLLAGTNHRVIARRLGISERTLARHIAEMREDYGVDSLFQLGYVLGRASRAM